MEDSIDTIGWIGNILLAFCGAIEACKAIYYKRSATPWALLIPWLLGEIFAIIPALFELNKDYLTFNYVANIVFISIIIYYKLKENKCQNQN